MPYEDKVVDVKVELGTQPIDTVGFETPMFLAMHNQFADRTRQYLSTDAMVADGFAVGSPAYNFADGAFKGKFAPQMVMIGRMDLATVKIDFTDQTNTEDVVINISAKGMTKAFKYEIAEGAVVTAEQIATNLHGLISADKDFTGEFVATVAGSVITITVTANKPCSVGHGAGNYKITSSSSETVATVLPQISAENHNWYFLATEAHSDADIVAAAGYALANYKFHVYTYAGEDALAQPNVVTSVCDTLASLSYPSLGAYDANADLTWPEGCIIGAMAANDPSYGDSLHLKEMPGMVPSNISESERANAWGRNANIYRSLYGVGAFIEGKVSNGQYADVIRFSHWVKFRMEESLFAYMHRRSNMGLSMKMSDDDLPVIRSVLTTNPINIGIRNGAILTGYDSVNKVSYDPTIQIPRRAEIPTNDLASRILRDVKVELVYNNALHYVKIRASVVLDRPAGTSTNNQTVNAGA